MTRADAGGDVCMQAQVTAIVMLTATSSMPKHIQDVTHKTAQSTTQVAPNSLNLAPYLGSHFNMSLEVR